MKLIFNFKQVVFPNADSVSAMRSSICLLHLAVLLFSVFSLLSQTVRYDKNFATYKFNVIIFKCCCDLQFIPLSQIPQITCSLLQPQMIISSSWVLPSCNSAYLAAHLGLVVSDLNRTDSSFLGLGKNRISLLASSS